ncbi:MULTISPECIES: branched-chain amino acid ABC transporter permease [unclassified Massilia]|uniref:branched-chain amino acid ABC transporter permease n=1 Tax=unclassified Massilia TaxID=2609279 RepID=UPI001B82FDAD|nr:MULTISPECIES: branched-chain amino acid ABC transporter permease [unclassified Massilia]MBQ5942083.1 branched-chain amino acid ABC transporter permease [Massilia sp. AB1]MBQ5962830.1 branched-chain amino acid ABC transporter permease [Massilia sp. ZL223]
MLYRLLSGDKPRSRALSAVLLLIFLGLAFAPFLTSGARPLNTAATICVYIVLVASYDLLLGYTGIVSFAHTMFYGIGAYGIGIGLSRVDEPTWSAALGGLGLALLLALALALVVGLFALRVRAIFYAMITLAVASSFAVLASQLSDITGGEDGVTFSVPEVLSPGFQLVEDEVFGRSIDGKLLTYYLVFFGCLLLFLFLLRLVNSPFGRVLQAVRENEFRAEALGYRTMVYRIWANCFAALVAALAGALMALWLRYVGPKTSLGFEVMTDILLIVVIGGMGTMYGAVVGAALFIIAQNYLKELMAHGSSALEGVPVLAAALHPDRWMLWLGVLFVLSIYFFPIGIVGKLRLRSYLAARR